jgi:hypothetical protein
MRNLSQIQVNILPRISDRVAETYGNAIHHFDLEEFSGVSSTQASY